MKKDWEIKHLGDVCEFVRGPFGGSLKKSIFKQSGYAVYEQQHAIYNQFSEIRYFIDENKFEEMKRFELRPNDLIMSCSGTMGKVAIVPDNIAKGIINQALLKLTCKSELNVDYLKLWMDSPLFISELEKNTVGAAIKNVASVKVLKTIQIPLPPLPEQQRIVAILDETFSAIDKAKANVEQNLKNAKELFESYLQGVFEKKGNGWEIKTLGEVSKINYGYTEKASFDEVGPKFLRITDIQENGVDWDTVPYCKCSDKDLPKYKLEKGDIVFARTGATTGKSYLIDNPPISVFASYLIRLRMNSINEFIPEFIYYFFQTKTYWDKINAGISGSAQGGFNATKLGELEFHFPKSKTEQQTNGRQLDALRVETQKLEAVYQKKIADLEELKKSILQKAFAGGLTESKIKEPCV